MTMRMLIDARHREETRVAVVKGNRIEEFDFESAERKQLKGNIYLAKVTRVEPSLQAAFVDYGGNRHGFLAFSEIHPDYYQIPKEDRDALLREEAEHAAEEAALRAEADAEADERGDDGEDGDDGGHFDDDDHDHGDHDDASETGEGEGDGETAPPKRSGRGSDDAVEALRQRRMNLRRRYKIQDVIRRRQVLLVQVVKEERGNKGAALTTYLSLAGRYCVLMPNTSHGGGISRKISNAGDRKRLKTIMAELKLPPSMGCIVRTAGLQRTKVEIKRDFDYLARLWDEIRENTLASAAPALVHADSDLIKRAIRDIYNKDIEEVIVEGDDGYAQAKQFMKLLMPSHARRVKHYSDPVPLFQRNHVEDQLGAMYHPVVQLKSGGYLVINPTEALVSIDINSGRSTREHNIEQTATATNLEAAQEIARQLRLRDMAGLVVIDFIDMDNNSNVRKVEKAMKEALKNDRARIQVGRISSFGLMEMSRQRLRTGVLEASTRQCPHCEGTGLVRTASSAGLSALRLLEDEAARGRGSLLTLRASQEAAFYMLNRKRAELAEIEERYGVTIEVASDGEQEGARMSVEASGPPPAHAPRFEPAMADIDEDDDIIDEIEDDEEEDDDAEADDEARDDQPRRAAASAESEGDRDARRKRRRRRGRRGRGRIEGEAGDRQDGANDNRADADSDADTDAGTDDGAGADADAGTDDGADSIAGEPDAPGEAREDGEPRRRRGRRGRRGGRRDTLPVEGDVTSVEAPVAADGGGEPVADDTPVEAAAEAAAEAAPKRARRRPRATAPVIAADTADAGTVVAAAAEPIAEPAIAAPAKAKRTRKPKAEAAEAPVAAATPVAVEPDAVEPDADAGDVPPPKPKRATAKPRAKAATSAAAPTKSAAPSAKVAAAARADEPATPAANDPALAEESAAGGGDGLRRGWWQRTFGA